MGNTEYCVFVVVDISNSVVVDKRGCPIDHEYTLVLSGWLGTPFYPLLCAAQLVHSLKRSFGIFSSSLVNGLEVSNCSDLCLAYKKSSLRGKIQ